jgi:hypothetical protein
MTKKKQKPTEDFSHLETDRLRATVINNPESETAQRLQKQFQSSRSLLIKVGEYLNSDDPLLQGCELSLQDFQPVLDHAKDEVLFLKFKPNDKTIIYHMTQHPDGEKVLSLIALVAKLKGFTLLDSKTIIEQTADIFIKKQAGTLKMKPGRHPQMGYLDKGSNNDQ